MSVPALVLKSEKKAVLDAGFTAVFGSQPERYFSAPGRTEISGNHTDHQHGCVLAGAVDLDTVAEKLLNGRGACCVRGGGFAGTIQTFVPHDLLEEFKNGMETVLGKDTCYVLSIRPQGGVEMDVEA